MKGQIFLMSFNKGLPKVDKTDKATPPVNSAALTTSPAITDDDLLPNVAKQSSVVAGEAPVAAPAAPAGMFLTEAMLAQIVASAVGAAMATVNQAGNQAIADSISTALTQHMGPRRLTVAEIGEPKTPFNPTGAKREMKSDFYQNGFPIPERYVSDAEIDLLHQLVPGSYGTPEFPIAVLQKKSLTGKSRIHIMYAEGKDDRLKVKNYAANFTLLLTRLVQEAKDQKAQRRADARALLADD